jgi:hypothetical protein
MDVWLIVAEDGTAEINWTLVNEENLNVKGCELTGRETENELLLKVITPWYRGYNTNNVACENKVRKLSFVSYVLQN